MPINTPTGYLDITNATLRGSKIVTTGYVGIANANPTNHLSIGSNLHINDTHSNVLQVSGNINAASVVLGGLSIAPTFDLEVITNTGNTTPYTVEFNNTATAFVTTANATIGDTLTASKLVGDGSGISAIQSSNVTDFASNVSRITTLESSRALKTDLDNNSARITNLSSNLSDNSSRITTVSNDLSDNSSRITTLESGDVSISGEKTFTGQVIFESNIHMAGGNIFVANTVNMTVSDPIIELGSNNLNTGDLGIVMTRHGATNSNVAFVYDESDDILKMGYTLNGANDTVVELDSNALAVGVQGTMTADKIVASNVIPATSTTTGALTVAGGVGVEGNVHCTNLYANNITMNLVSFSGLQTFEQVVNNGRVLSSNVLIISNATPSTSSTTGALTLTGGGLGVAGNVSVGSNLTVTDETTLSNLTVTEETALANISVTGETVEVANLAVTSGSLELTQVANVFQVKSSSNVVTEYVRSKKLIKYPRVAMTAATSGGYTASASNENTGAQRYAYKAFDNNIVTEWQMSGTNNSSAEGYDLTSPYNANSNSPTITDNNGNDHTGAWVKLQLPGAIKISSMYIRAPSSNRRPNSAVLLGSNDDSTWYVIKDTFTVANQDENTISVTESSYYQYVMLLVKSLTGNEGQLQIKEIEYYGIPEYDPDAHGTDVIARSVPNVPNTDWLEVYYDGQDYTSMPSSVTDKSGNGLTGTVGNGTAFDSTWNAFEIPGTTQGITVNTTRGANPLTSVGCWVKFTEFSGTELVMLAGNSGINGQMIWFGATGTGTSWAISTGGAAAVKYTSYDIKLNTWYHLVACWHAGSYPGDMGLYVNGVLLPVTSQVSNITTLSLPTTTTIRIGWYLSSTEAFIGSIANFRLFNRALTADEVWQLYAYQKDYFQVSPDVVTFKGGRLGIGTLEPKAPLDVMGIPYGRGAKPCFSASRRAGNVSTGYTIIFDHVEVNQQNGYNSTNGVFTAPVSGLYLFSFYGMTEDTGNAFGIRAYKNGDTYERFWPYTHHSGASAHKHVSGTQIVPMNTGDTFKFNVQTGTLYGGSNGHNSFVGYLIE